MSDRATDAPQAVDVHEDADIGLRDDVEYASRETAMELARRIIRQDQELLRRLAK